MDRDIDISSLSPYLGTINQGDVFWMKPTPHAAPSPALRIRMSSYKTTCLTAPASAP